MYPLFNNWKSNLVLGVATGLAAIVLTGCAKNSVGPSEIIDGGDIASGYIGSAGGGVSGDGYGIEVPAGVALDETRFDISSLETVPASPSSLSAEGVAVGFSSDQSFDGYVKVSLPADSGNVFRHDGIDWRYLGGVSEDGTVSAVTDQFSPFEILHGDVYNYSPECNAQGTESTYFFDVGQAAEEYRLCMWRGTLGITRELIDERSLSDQVIEETRGFNSQVNESVVDFYDYIGTIPDFENYSNLFGGLKDVWNMVWNQEFEEELDRLTQWINSVWWRCTPPGRMAYDLAEPGKGSLYEVMDVLEDQVGYWESHDVEGLQQSLSDEIEAYHDVIDDANEINDATNCSPMSGLPSSYERNLSAYISNFAGQGINFAGTNLEMLLSSEDVIYVDDDNTNYGTGTFLDPFKQIGYATEAAEDGDTISVAPGTYDSFNTDSKDGLIIGAVGGPAVTFTGHIATGGSAGASFNCSLSGFSARDMLVDGDYNVIKNCVFDLDTSGRIHFRGNGTVFRQNTVIVRDDIHNGKSASVAIAPDVEMELVNNIILGTEVGCVDAYRQACSVFGLDVDSKYNDYFDYGCDALVVSDSWEGDCTIVPAEPPFPGVYAYSCGIGDTDFSADPLFVDFDNEDYRLAPGSPCIGAGENGEDLGAFGGVDFRERLRSFTKLKNMLHRRLNR